MPYGSGACSRAVDDSNRGLGHASQGPRCQAVAAHRIGAGFLCFRLGRGSIYAAPDVTARTECTSSTNQCDSAHRRVGGSSQDGILQHMV